MRPCYQSNQQYSIIALTDESGTVTERYAYDAYGKPTVFDGAGNELAGGSAENNRYMYTGQEWDADLALYHFGGRMYDPWSGRFISRDPSGYSDGYSLYRLYIGLQHLGPTGRAIVAIDKLGSGVGQLVLIVQGSSARQAQHCRELPIDAIIVGIVDEAVVMGKTIEA